MFGASYRYWLMLALGGYSYLNTLFAEVYTYYDIHAAWPYALLTIVLMTAAVWEFNRLLEPVFLNRVSSSSVWVKLGWFFLAGTGIAIIVAISAVWLIGKYAAALDDKDFQVSAKLAVMYATRVNLFLHTINAIFVFVGSLRKKELEAEELKRSSVQSQLQAIRNQINPHFLFNNLNVLSGLVIKTNPEANKFVEAFANVYRYLLSNQDTPLVSLRSELDFMEQYLYLLRQRFPESLLIAMDVPPTSMDKKIVPGALQLLVENAIKHNRLSRQEPLLIELAVNGTSELIVTNNLQMMHPVETSTQIGLANIKQRYELTTGKSIKVQKDDYLFRVILPLIT